MIPALYRNVNPVEKYVEIADDIQIYELVKS